MTIQKYVIVKYLCLLLVISASLLYPGNLFALEIFPEVAGYKSSDSVTLTFETFDTTALPLPANPDSLKILRFNPAGSLFDSLGEDDGRVANIREGSYLVRFKSSDADSTPGTYSVRVYAYAGGQIRGASSGGYYITASNWNILDSINQDLRAVLDTLNNGFASQSGQSYLDAAISSRSDLTASDNIGINWQDIDNSTAIQFLQNTIVGAVSGMVAVDTAKIARSVWDNDIVPEAGRGVDLSLCQPGAGEFACSLYVFNAADSSALQGVSLRIMNNSQNATVAVGVTNSEGLVAVYLDSAQYKIWAYKAGIEFAALPDSIIIAAPSVNDTLWGADFAPGDPGSAELCRVYGWVHDLSGESIAGATVSVRLCEGPVRYQGSILSPFYKTITTDASGYWNLEVYPSASLTPDSSKYEFIIYYEPGRIVRREVLVPDLASWELSW